MICKGMAGVLWNPVMKPACEISLRYTESVGANWNVWWYLRMYLKNANAKFSQLEEPWRQEANNMYSMKYAHRFAVLCFVAVPLWVAGGIMLCNDTPILFRVVSLTHANSYVDVFMLISNKPMMFHEKCSHCISSSMFYNNMVYIKWSNLPF